LAACIDTVTGCASSWKPTEVVDGFREKDSVSVLVLAPKLEARDTPMAGGALRFPPAGRALRRLSSRPGKMKRVGSAGAPPPGLAGTRGAAAAPATPSVPSRVSSVGLPLCQPRLPPRAPRASMRGLPRTSGLGAGADRGSHRGGALLALTLPPPVRLLEMLELALVLLLCFLDLLRAFRPWTWVKVPRWYRCSPWSRRWHASRGISRARHRRRRR